MRAFLLIAYANSLKTKKAFAKGKSSNFGGLIWYTNMAALSLFRNTILTTLTSMKTLYIYPSTWCNPHIKRTREFVGNFEKNP